MAERNSVSNETLREEHHDLDQSDSTPSTIRNNNENDAADPEKEKAKDPEKNQPEHPEHPEPISIWHPATKPTKIEFFKGWTKTVIILMTFIMGVLSLYWGVLYRAEDNLASLTVAIVDFDGKVAPYTNTQPLIGPLFVQAAEMERATRKYSVGYVIRDPAEYNYDPIEVRRSIYDERDWAAIIINANATALLEEAVATGNSSYDPLGAVQLIYIAARDSSTYSGDILPPVNLFLLAVQDKFGRQWIQDVLSNRTLRASTYSRTPQALNPAIGWSVFNLRPFTPAVATATTTIGLIYLIIVSFFSFGFFLPHHIKFLKSPTHNPVHYWHMCVWKLIATMIAYGFMSLAYSLVSLAFQIPFSNTFPHDDISVAVTPDAYGRASFVVYWMVNWLGMTALGLASENVTMMIGQPWVAMWLIFWVITNVSTSFYPLELLPTWYRWGYAWPLYNIVHATKTIIFDVKSNIGLNIGVLCAWIVVDVLLFFPCCFLMRWKTTKAKAKTSPRGTVRYIVSG